MTFQAEASHLRDAYVVFASVMSRFVSTRSEILGGLWEQLAYVGVDALRFVCQVLCCVSLALHIVWLALRFAWLTFQFVRLAFHIMW